LLLLLLLLLLVPAQVDDYPGLLRVVCWVFNGEGGREGVKDSA
jgi:hypothetical protein